MTLTIVSPPTPPTPPEAVLEITPNSDIRTNNNIVFSCDNREMLKITSDGFFVEGIKIRDNQKIYNKMVHWINHTLQDFVPKLEIKEEELYEEESI